MPSYLQIDNISKSYGPKVLFKNISLNINEGDKIALVAPNGTGKSSLLKILAGKDSSDMGGTITFLRDVKIAFLEQEQSFNLESTIYETIKADSVDVPDYKIKEVLFSLNIKEIDRQLKELSGGELKRIAIAQMFIKEPDFFIMDEPTNHLDLDSIEYLEDYLGHKKCTLLMVTHDRYFLDRVCNKIIEMDRGKLYEYNGNYSYFLEKRDERINNLVSEADKARNLLKVELDWMRRMPCARGTKAKYRVNAFYELKDKAVRPVQSKSININMEVARLGKKIINCKNVSYNWESWIGLRDFSYNFIPGEKIGIVGGNGVGKSTFLNILTGEIKPTSGIVEVGETIKYGYYKQSGISFNADDKIIDIVNDTALLNRFLFPPSTHFSKVATLSGGEKRRLYLLKVLMAKPNLLILDEPTNDLDILTLNVLEDYLKDYSGSVLIVSHDRFFLDKIVDHLFVFCGNGVVKDFVGSYMEYREYIKELKRAEKATAKQAESNRDTRVRTNSSNKLTYKEKRELEALEIEIPELEAKKADILSKLESGSLSADELISHSKQLGEMIQLIDSKTERWLELSDR